MPLVAAQEATAADIAVHPDDLGPAGPWYRLQDDPSNAGKAYGTQEVAPFADAEWLDGSLHLGLEASEQSQAAHPFSAPIPLSTLLSTGISYSAYQNSAASTAGNTGANLQFPMICGGTFTTISFEPGRNVDSEGRNGVVPDTWQHFVATASSSWRTSQAAAGIPAQGDATLQTFADACAAPGDGALGVIAKIGQLGSPTATLDTYVDGITVAGNTYNFAVTGKATAKLSAPATLVAGGPAGQGTVTFTNPADGPEYPDIGTELTLTGPSGLRPEDVTVMVAGRRVPLTLKADGTLVGTLPEGTTLAPGDSSTTRFSIAVAAGAPPGRLTLNAELTAAASGGSRKPVGVVALGALEIKAQPSPSPSPTEPSPSPSTEPTPTPSRTTPPPAPTGPELADTGVADHRLALGVTALLGMAGGFGSLVWARRRRV
jgi:hypothetical protein